MSLCIVCAQVQAALAAAEAGSSQPPDLEQLLEQLVLDDGDLKPQELKVWTAEECGAGIDAGMLGPAVCSDRNGKMATQ